MSDAPTIRAPRGTRLTCRGWAQEAAYRMLCNNLDPEVAERPQDLVVYGGTGKAARDWPSFHRIVAALKRLKDDETLLVQSGKPVGIFRTHEYAPRVLIANSLLVPHWATWEHFWELERLGLMMYGQMTAGSWIYIGTQGILQGTYETFNAVAAKRFGGSLKGRVVLTSGLGGMGGAQPLAVTMNGGVALCIEVDPARIERRVKTRYLDRATRNLEEALRWADEARSAGEAASIGVQGNAAEVYPALLAAGFHPDVVTDQTSAHDPLRGYIPAPLSVDEAADIRARDPEEYLQMVKHSVAAHVTAMRERQPLGQRHDRLRTFVIEAADFVCRAAHPEAARRNKNHVRSRLCYRPVKSPGPDRRTRIEPQIIRCRQLEKIETLPSICFGKVRDEFNRVNGANRPRDGQPRIQLHVESRRRLGRGPWHRRPNGQAKQGKQSNAG